MWPFKKNKQQTKTSVPASAPAKAPTPVDTRTAIREVKKRIKDLAVTQKKGKRARKTTIPAEERAKLLKEFNLVGASQWKIANAVIERRGEITAHLNFYRELRGKEACHGVRDGAEYAYAVAMDSLRREFPISV